ncbi:hypothetical protein RFI_20837, partial [Reticulomyxa filosa]
EEEEEITHSKRFSPVFTKIKIKYYCHWTLRLNMRLFWLLIAQQIWFILVGSGDSSTCLPPLLRTRHANFEKGCGLYCHRDLWTSIDLTSDEIKIVNGIYMSVLLLSLVCNIIFLINNITEHVEKRESFFTSTVSYDALFFCNIAYFLVYISLFIPHLTHVLINDRYSTFVCNSGMLQSKPIFFYIFFNYYYLKARHIKFSLFFSLHNMYRWYIPLKKKKKKKCTQKKKLKMKTLAIKIRVRVTIKFALSLELCYVRDI